MNMQGKTRTETIGRAKMRGKRDQGKTRETNFSGNQDHGKAIKFNDDDDCFYYFQK